MSKLKYIKTILVLLLKATLLYLCIESIFIGAVRPISILSLW